MPTPLDQEWLTAKQMGLHMMKAFVREFKGDLWFDGGVEWTAVSDGDSWTITMGPVPFPAKCMMAQAGIKGRMQSSLKRGFGNTGYLPLRKLVRTFEKLRDRMASGELDASSQLRQLVRDIFTAEFLDSIDEDGNLLVEV